MAKPPDEPRSDERETHGNPNPLHSAATNTRDGENFGLSPAELREVLQSLVAMAKRRGIPEHLDPHEIANAAFVKALEKPISERPSTANRKRLVGWLRPLVEFEIKTHRNSKHEKLLGEGNSDEELEALLAIVPRQGESLAASEAWRIAMTTLGAEDRALLIAHDEHDQTIQDIAREQQLPRSRGSETRGAWSTTDWFTFLVRGTIWGRNVICSTEKKWTFRS